MSVTKRRRLPRSILLGTVAFFAYQMEAARAHTVSIGYAFAGPASVNFWYGSYHADATFNEANLQLVGPSVNSTRDFILLSATKPTGLVDGVNNFYSNTAGTALVAAPEIVASTDGSGGAFDPATQDILNWQGVTFTGLKPGTYTFTYNPLALPTVEWHPINDVIRTNTFTLTVADVLGFSSFIPFARNWNQYVVARGLDGAIAAGAFNQSFYNLALLSPTALAAALTQLSGEALTGAGRASFLPMNSILGLLLDPWITLRGGAEGDFGPGFGSGGWPGSGAPPSGPGYGNGNGYGGNGYGGNGYGDGSGYGNGTANGNGYGNGNPGRRYATPFDRNWSVWAAPYGAVSTVAGDVTIGSHAAATQAGGIVAGADYRFAPGTVAGFAVAGGTSTWGLSDGLGSGSSDALQAGVYGSTRFGPAYLSAALAYGWSRIATGRTMTLAGMDHLTASFGAQTFGGRLEGGYRFDIPGVGVTPYAALQVQSLRAPAYSEAADAGTSTFALNVDGRTANDTRTELGVWLDTQTALNPETLLVLRGRVAWLHEWMDDPSITATFQQFQGPAFTVLGAGNVPNAALVSAGAEWRMRGGLSVGLKFDGEFASRSQIYAGTGTVRYQW